MKITMHYVFAICLLMMFAEHSLAATQFNDRATWRAAAGGGTGDLFDDFNDVVNDINDLTPALDRGDYALLDDSVVAGSFIDGSGDDGGSTAFTNVNGSSYLYVSAEGVFGSIADELKLIFDQPVTALGLDYKPDGASASELVNYVADTGEGGSFLLPSNQQPGFIGWVFDNPINELRFTRLNADNSSKFGADNLEAYSVPEPTSLALLGLGGLVMLRRNRVEEND